MLSIDGNCTNHIWIMEDGPEGHSIGIRLDCGDSGTIYFSYEQAMDLSNQICQFMGVNEPFPDNKIDQTK